MGHWNIFVQISALLGMGVLSSCALPAAPEGGPKDTTPPAVVHCTPPVRATRIHPTELVVVFDEYIQAPGAAQKLISSPPLPPPVRVEVKGKKIIVSWGGTLDSSATYAIALGGLIKDIHEGTLLPEFTAVFSTGSHVDSLGLVGVLTSALTHKPLDKYAVALWDSRVADSAVIKESPRYIARTDGQGRFALRFLAPGAYRCIAFEDPDGNSRLGAGERVAMGWSPQPVVSGDTTLVRLLATSTESTKDSLLPWPEGLDKERSGEVTLNIVTETEVPFVVQWMDEKGRVRFQTTVVRSWKQSFTGIPPGKYTLRGFFDRQANGKYDPGDFWKAQAPEEMLTGVFVEVKAFWETSADWAVPPPGLPRP